MSAGGKGGMMAVSGKHRESNESKTRNHPYEEAASWLEDNHREYSSIKL